MQSIINNINNIFKTTNDNIYKETKLKNIYFYYIYSLSLLHIH